MAKRGRKPDPPKLRILKANAGRDAGPFAAVRAGGEPPKPETIAADPIASAIWDRTASLLNDRRVLSPADEGVLVAYCSAFATVVRVREALLGRDLVVTNFKTGAVKAHPLLGVLSGAERSLHSFAGTLGLTPTDRGRVEVIGDGEAGMSKLEQLNAAAIANRNRFVRSGSE
jgi:P27 family predicted phage terminase small subunit